MKPKKVAIVGAGPSGLICAKECRKEGLEVQIFEKRAALGGTWLLDPIPSELQHLDVLGKDYGQRSSRIHSSMYENLRTNLPRHIMGFTDYPFDRRLPSSMDPRAYCSYEEVKNYVEDFAEHFDLRDLVAFNTEVIRIEHMERTSPEWDVEIVSENQSRVGFAESTDQLELHFYNQVVQADAVVIANGHSTVPRVPETKNIDQFQRLLLHSHLYRNPAPFRSMRVAILGNSNSGMDLALEIGEVAEEVFVCGRTWRLDFDLTKPIGSKSNIHFCKNIDRCAGAGELLLEDGRVISDLDVLIYCTGYVHSIPFLKEDVIVEEKIVRPLYKHIFPPHRPTLAFLTLLANIVPFLVAEYQAKFVARVFSGRVQLPDSKSMLQEVEALIESHLAGGESLETFFSMSNGRQFQYMNHLAALCRDVERLPTWRSAMYQECKAAKRKYKLWYRDVDPSDPCYEQAETEFSELRRREFNDS